jgi:hypothetical protein
VLTTCSGKQSLAAAPVKLVAVSDFSLKNHRFLTLDFANGLSHNKLTPAQSQKTFSHSPLIFQRLTQVAVSYPSGEEIASKVGAFLAPNRG